MQAIVQTDKETVEVQERDRPSPGPGEVLVDIHAAGLCGSDAHAYKIMDGYEWIPIPRIMGHEYSGCVAAVGDGVTDFEPGDKVVEAPIHDCGHCFQCRNGQSNVCQHFQITGMHHDGAFTNARTVAHQYLHHVPDDVPLTRASLTEPLSIATRAVIDRSRVEPGSNVLVEGPGPIGVLAAIVADSIGARVTVSGMDRDATHRLPIVEDLGIETINAERDDLTARTEAVTVGGGWDVIFDTTGHRTGIEMAAEHVRRGGQIVIVGLPGSPSEVFMTPLVRGEIDITASYGSMWRNFEQALRLIADGLPVDALQDHAYEIATAANAFEDFLAGQTLKPVFHFDDA